MSLSSLTDKTVILLTESDVSSRTDLPSHPTRPLSDIHPALELCCPGLAFGFFPDCSLEGPTRLIVDVLIPSSVNVVLGSHHPCWLLYLDI